MTSFGSERKKASPQLTAKAAASSTWCGAEDGVRPGKGLCLSPAPSHPSVDFQTEPRAKETYGRQLLGNRPRS